MKLVFIRVILLCYLDYLYRLRRAPGLDYDSALITLYYNPKTIDTVAHDGWPFDSVLFIEFY